MEENEGPLHGLTAGAAPAEPASVLPRFVAVRVRAAPAAAEAAAALLHEAAPSGVEEQHQGDDVVLVAYLPTDLAPRLVPGLRARLEAFPRFGLGEAPTVEVEPLAEEEWATAWRRHFRPFPVGRRLWIAPSWAPGDPPDGRLAVRIDAGVAFGSGLHASTRLCLELLEDLVRPGVTVVDVGTGSGILAVAAARLGAARVVATDLDPVAAQAAALAVRANDLRGVVAVVVGDLLAAVRRPAEVVVANLTADLLERLAPHVPPALAPEGRFIASGIAAAQAARVREALAAAGLAVVRERVREGWHALVAQLLPDGRAAMAQPQSGGSARASSSAARRP